MTKYQKLEKYLKHDIQNTWLITGVAGFIGSNLLERLLCLNQKVVGLDNFETGYQSNIDAAIADASVSMGIDELTLRQNFKFIEGDIRNIEDCFKACKDVDYVLHQAALGSVPRSIKDPINTNSVNISGFLNMLVAAKEENVKSFVYAASSSTYGDHPALPKVEDEIGNPLSPYAVTKLANELYAGVFAKTYSFKTIGLRYFNIFGKRQDPNGAYAAVIPKWVSSMLGAQKIFINGDGETSRDFCHVDNAIQMNLLSAIADPAAVDQVYNVAVNERTGLNQLYKMIENGLIKRVSSLKREAPNYRDFRAGDVRHSLADITKAKKLLGYEPIYTLEKGLDISLDWYLENSLHS